MSAWNSNGLTVRTVTTVGDTVRFTDDVIIYTNTAAKGAALAAASSSSVQPGKVYRFVNAATGALTITPASGTIDGASTLVVAATTGRAEIVSDGTNWFSISSVPAAA